MSEKAYREKLWPLESVIYVRIHSTSTPLIVQVHTVVAENKQSPSVPGMKPF